MVKFKGLFLTLFSLFVIFFMSLVGLLPSLLNREDSVREPSIQTEKNPVFGEEFILDPGVVSISWKEDQPLILYNSQIYSKQSLIKGQAETDLEIKTFDWTSVALAPETVAQGQYLHDSVFSLDGSLQIPSAVFIMQWGNGVSPVRYYLYHVEKSTSREVAVFEPSGEDYQIPRIHGLSPDHLSVALEMYKCWQCGGHQPELLLLKLATGQGKRLGKVSYFHWLQAGKYEYKEFIEKPCSFPSAYVCFEDPTNLSLKTGQF